MPNHSAQLAPVRRRLASVLVVAAVAGGAILAGAGASQAVPAAATNRAHPASETVTMVNGAGRTITLPATLAAAARSAASAGFAGTAPTAAAGAKKVTGDAGGPATADGRGGGPTANIVIPPFDGRSMELDPAAYPWRAIAWLDLRWQSILGSRCTGFMVSRDVLVTAGHCVYQSKLGGWPTGYRAVPGKRGPNQNATDEPYGSCSGTIHDVWTNIDWVATEHPDFDYGLVKLTCDIGNTVGAFGTWYNLNESLGGEHFYVEGYPTDKSPSGTLWWHGENVTTATTNRLWYLIDTGEGQSGSPVYHQDSVTPGLCTGWCVTGIHTGSDGSTNYGTRFNPVVMEFINYWINQP